MRAVVWCCFALAACNADHHASPDAPAIAIDAAVDAPDGGPDPLRAIYGEVDGAHLAQLVQEMSGALPAIVDGATITIDQRYDDAGRARFRAYWTQTMRGLGLDVTAFDYPDADRPGTDLEAVLPGASPDSIVVIVHYDSIGPPGQETQNPGADDDMSGMAIELETARILVAHRTELAYTIRFVASDEEELGGLAGARFYANHIHAAAQSGGWNLVASIDDEQTGWNCHTTNQCNDPSGAAWPTFDVFSCSGPGDNFMYDYPAIGDRLAAIAAAYSPLHVARGCIGQNSDHYAMWEIGVPSVVYTEHNPFGNDHFDQQGGDLYSRIDMDYLTAIARVGITFQAALAFAK